MILRLLRGEAINAVSRLVQAPAYESEAWRPTFLDAGAEG